MLVQSLLTTGKSDVTLSFPTFVPRRYRPGNLGTWSGHLPFAADLVAALKPTVLVELGTHFGESYFTFCQSVVENQIPCACYAVDHWLGETHAGFYGEDVFEEVRVHNEAHYAWFSHLLRMSFDEAREQFADSSIDLLHIDGLHTYDAVRHDFRNWYPKVGEGGIVLLHDIAARHADFGVWRFWKELSAEFPETFAFQHSSGLGVFRKPGPRREWNELLDTLFEGDAEVQEQLRRRYVIYSSHLENRFESELRDSKSAWTAVQVYTSIAGTYSEAASTKRAASFQHPETLTFILPEGTGDGPLRIDPADCPCVIELTSLNVTDEKTGDVLWQGSAQDFPQLKFGGSAIPLASLDTFAIFSYGDDPQMFLPCLPGRHGRALVKVQLQFRRTFEAVAECLGRMADGSAITPRRKENTFVQVFIRHDASYSEEWSVKQEIPLGDWQTLALTLPYQASIETLRIDPSATPCAIEIAAIEARKSGRVVWAARDPKALRSLEISNLVVGPRADKYVLLSPGHDPQLRLPRVPFEDGADSVQITLRLDSSPEALIGILADVAESDGCTTSAFCSSIQSVAAERSTTAAQISQIATERNDLRRELHNLTESARAREEAFRADIALVQSLKHSKISLEEQLLLERTTRHELEHSHSWRLTKPLRALNRLISRR